MALSDEETRWRLTEFAADWGGYQDTEKAEAQTFCNEFLSCFLRDLAVSIADGGNCVSDLEALRGQGALFGPVASETTAHRVLKSIDSELLAELRRARALARERAWAGRERPERLTLDLDATIVCAHSEKEDAAGTYKRSFSSSGYFLGAAIGIRGSSHQDGDPGLEASRKPGTAQTVVGWFQRLYSYVVVGRPGAEPPG